MGFAWTLGLRYLRSKKRAFISVGTLFAILGVALGVAALATVMSVTGGFQKQFRDKVLGVNAHVLILKRTPEFHEYRQRMEQARKIPGVIGVAPFVINPMLVTAGDKTATGVLMKGVDPELMPSVLDLPKHIQAGSLAGLRRPGAKPPERPRGVIGFDDTVDDHGQPAGTSSGAPAPSGSAPSDPFLKLLEKKHAEVKKQNEEIAKSEAEQEATAKEPLAAASASASVAGPAGAIEPPGGYKSDLPPDDFEDKAVQIGRAHV
jgi:lipoprotein-releasing system permease protein